MKVNICGYELDTSSSYIDRDNDIVHLVKASIEEFAIFSTVDEISFKPTEQYVSTLREVVVSKSTVEKAFKPEVGKLYMFGDRKETMAHLMRLVSINEDGTFTAKDVAGFTFAFRYCDPLGDEWEIGR